MCRLPISSRRYTARDKPGTYFFRRARVYSLGSSENKDYGLLGLFPTYWTHDSYCLLCDSCSYVLLKRRHHTVLFAVYVLRLTFQLVSLATRTSLDHSSLAGHCLDLLSLCYCCISQPRQLRLAESPFVSIKSKTRHSRYGPRPENAGEKV